MIAARHPSCAGALCSILFTCTVQLVLSLACLMDMITGEGAPYQDVLRAVISIMRSSFMMEKYFLSRSFMLFFYGAAKGTSVISFCVSFAASEDAKTDCRTA